MRGTIPCIIITAVFAGERRQMTLDDLMEASTGKRSTELKKLLESLSARYHLDFAGHLDQIYQMDVLHKTVEYMRKHFPG